MPTYDYRCKDCGHSFEIHQSFTDDALTECPQCHGNLRKVFGNVGISFKGSGFYKTDSRASSSTSSKSTASAESSSSGTSGSDSSTSSGSDSSGSDSSSSGDKSSSDKSSGEKKSSDKKRADTAKGKQHSKQPEHAAAVTKEARLEEMSVADLRKKAATAKIGGRSKMTKAELVKALEAA